MTTQTTNQTEQTDATVDTAKLTSDALAAIDKIVQRAVKAGVREADLYHALIYAIDADTRMQALYRFSDRGQRLGSSDGTFTRRMRYGGVELDIVKDSTKPDATIVIHSDIRSYDRNGEFVKDLRAKYVAKSATAPNVEAAQDKLASQFGRWGNVIAEEMHRVKETSSDGDTVKTPRKRSSAVTKDDIADIVAQAVAQALAAQAKNS